MHVIFSLKYFISAVGILRKVFYLPHYYNRDENNNFTLISLDNYAMSKEFCEDSVVFLEELTSFVWVPSLY
jgi:hypothetical protein